MPRSPTCTCGRCYKCLNRGRMRASRAADPEGTRAKRRAWYEARRAKVMATNTAWRKADRLANPEKWKARNAISNGLRLGTVTRQPCEVCGDPKSQAHHEDYAKPLDVRWLCRRHHWAEHTG